MLRPAIVAALLLAFALSLESAAAGPETGVGIATLDCTAEPETVILDNQGSAAQDLAGWQLQSDPDETFDLSSLGAIQPGATVTVQSGPAASGVFVWDSAEVFRDDDGTDYARLVDDSGATVEEVACAEATPQATAEPTPEPSPVGDVPDGGGPPPPGEGVSPALLVLAGAVLGAAGLAALALSRPRAAR
ncbi:MAG: lamin tail domain-containing protein [Dehalococcoidia bacterium]